MQKQMVVIDSKTYMRHASFCQANCAKEVLWLIHSGEQFSLSSIGQELNDQ